MDEANKSNDGPSFDIGLTTVDEGIFLNVNDKFKMISSREGNIRLDAEIFAAPDRPRNWLFKQFYGISIGQALALHGEADRDAIELLNAVCTHKLRFQSRDLGLVVLSKRFVKEVLEGTDWGGGVRTERDVMGEALRDELVWEERREMRLRMVRAGVLQ